MYVRTQHIPRSWCSIRVPLTKSQQILVAHRAAAFVEPHHARPRYKAVHYEARSPTRNQGLYGSPARCRGEDPGVADLVLAKGTQASKASH